MWLVLALLSAVFAELASILAKFSRMGSGKALKF